MRFAIAAIVAAGLAASPAVAQEANEANTAVVGQPAPAGNSTGSVFPVTEDTISALPAPPPGGEIVEQAALQPDTRDGGGFPWGLLGLLGLLGMLGLSGRARS